MALLVLRAEPLPWAGCSNSKFAVFFNLTIERRAIERRAMDAEQWKLEQIDFLVFLLIELFS